VGAGIGDEVVAAILATEIPAIELQCHGGPAAVSLVLRAIELAGARNCERSELAVLDYPSGDELCARALDDLSSAPTVRTAEILLEQAQGALSAAVVRLAELAKTDRVAGLAALELLIARSSLGLRLLCGWKVVIAGRPNVGKSRLLNALCGFHRAIVDEVPGTTRDVVAFRTAIEGWPVELADTAGVRTTVDEIESLGVEKTRKELETADLVLLVLDRSENLRPIDRQLIEEMPRALVVANKSDLPAAWRFKDAQLVVEEVLTVSAQRGDGLVELTQAIMRRLVPNPPSPREAIPFRQHHVDVLQRARYELLASRPFAAAELLNGMISRSEQAVSASLESLRASGAR
jgi:tRNA modification GTPase